MEAGSLRDREGPARVELGDVFVLLGAVLLLVSLFLDWFDPGFSAWTVFESLDLVLAALAVLALLAVAGTLLRAAYVPAGWLPAIAVAALVIVAGALINHPPAVLNESPRTGAWLGLAAALLLVLGAGLRRARVSLAIRFESSRSGAAGAPPPPPPAPPPRDEGTAPTRNLPNG